MQAEQALSIAFQVISVATSKHSPLYCRMLEVTGGSMSTIYETSHADFPAVYAVRRQVTDIPLHGQLLLMFLATCISRSVPIAPMQASELRRQNEASSERLVEEGQAAHQPQAVPTPYSAPGG